MKFSGEADAPLEPVPDSPEYREESYEEEFEDWPEERLLLGDGFPLCSGLWLGAGVGDGVADSLFWF